MTDRKRPNNETGLRVPSMGATTLRSESELIDFLAESKKGESYLSDRFGMRGGDVSPFRTSVDTVNAIRGDGWNRGAEGLKLFCA
jgi:hypothetical protein